MMTALEAAQYLVGACGETLDEVKLHALLYYAQGWCLALRGEPLFDDPIEAWACGPVIPSVFRALNPGRDDLAGYGPEDWTPSPASPPKEGQEDEL